MGCAWATSADGWRGSCRLCYSSRPAERVGSSPSAGLKESSTWSQTRGFLLGGLCPTDTENKVAAGAAGGAGDVPGTAAMGTAELGIFN